jgi:predicted phosphodiesterase
MSPDESLAAFDEKMKEPAPGGFWSLPLKDRGDGWSVIGAVSDTHLGSKHHRPDVLKTLYRLFETEGVTDVYHAGNWIEGESRLNRHDIAIFGLDAQVSYMIQEYPAVPGLTTHLIAGDDHEGWYQQREQISIGKHLEEKAAASGRNDLHFIGYVEADIYLKTPLGASCKMRVMHGGGGSTYAISYPPQKAIESFQPGEKPDILVLGHHHKLFYSYIRGVHVVEPGCTADQSIFMRKRHIEAHVGGSLLYIRQNTGKGFVTDFVPRFKTFYDRTFTSRTFDV